MFKQKPIPSKKTQKEIQARKDKVQDDILKRWPEFRCPISQQIMKDPVICPDGFTYDKEYIYRWLDARQVSPMNPVFYMTKSQMVPNRALRDVMGRNGCACKGYLPPVEDKDPPLESENITFSDIETFLTRVYRIFWLVVVFLVFCAIMFMGITRERGAGGSWPYEYKQGEQWKVGKTFNLSYVRSTNGFCSGFINKTCEDLKRQTYFNWSRHYCNQTHCTFTNHTTCTPAEIAR